VQGKLHQAHDTYRQGFQLAAKAAQQSGQLVPAAVYVYFGLADLLREWNELDEADTHLKQGLDLGRKWQIGGDTLRDGYLVQARLKQALGDVTGAQEAIRQAQELAPSYQSVPGFGDPIAACRARLRLAQAIATGDTGHLETLEQWVGSHELRADGSIDSLHNEFAYLVYARLLIAQSEADRALQLLRRLLQAAEDGGRRGRVIEIWTLQALAHQVLGDAERALMTIEGALSLAEPEGYIRLFVDEGRPMAKLLRQAASRGIAVAYADKLLAAFLAEERRSRGAGEKASPPPPLPPRSPAPIEPLRPPALTELLSERELEVLRLIAVGLTNREIAETLVIALGTAKAHTASIYAKLDVHNRTQAVARARELGLL
jgi:LuxR family maltose regulon positive regulatory protein